MASRTYQDGDDRIVVNVPDVETRDAFVEVTRLVKDARGRYRLEESTAIGLDVWRQIVKDGSQ